MKDLVAKIGQIDLGKLPENKWSPKVTKLKKKDIFQFVACSIELHKRQSRAYKILRHNNLWKNR